MNDILVYVRQETAGTHPSYSPAGRVTPRQRPSCCRPVSACTNHPQACGSCDDMDLYTLCAHVSAAQEPTLIVKQKPEAPLLCTGRPSWGIYQ